MENNEDASRQLMFVEPVNKDTDTEELLLRLIKKLESIGFNIIAKDVENKKEGSNSPSPIN